MSDFNLTEKLISIPDSVSTILLWGDDACDCELQSMYLHEAVFSLPSEHRVNYFCQGDVKFSDDIYLFLQTVPSANEQFNALLPVTIVIQQIQNLNHREQAWLLKKIISKFDKQFLHCRFVLISDREVQLLIPELNHYYMKECFYVSDFSSRRPDVIPLAKFILERYCRKRREAVPSLSLDAERYLLTKPWTAGILSFVSDIEQAAENYFNYQTSNHTIMLSHFANLHEECRHSESEVMV